MKEFIGKNCKILIEISENKLFFEAKPVISVSENHISFIDRYGKKMCFGIDKVASISEF